MINPSSEYRLEVRGSPDEGFYVDNLSEEVVKTAEDMWLILQKGETNRAHGSHALNEYSSRSHAILTIEIESNMDEGEIQSASTITKYGKIFFVDLAGSESVRVTEAKGIQLRETSKINKSLLALGKIGFNFRCKKRKKRFLEMLIDLIASF